MRWFQSGRLFSRRLSASLFAVAAAAVLMATPARSEEVLKHGDVITGKLRVVHVRHPSGTLITAYQIVSEPRKAPADDEFCDDKVSIFHVLSMEPPQVKLLRPLLGKQVSLKANSFFCSETAWHIGDVVVSEWSELQAVKPAPSASQTAHAATAKPAAR